MCLFQHDTVQGKGRQKLIVFFSQRESRVLLRSPALLHWITDKKRKRRDVEVIKWAWVPRYFEFPQGGKHANHLSPLASLRSQGGNEFSGIDCQRLHNCVFVTPLQGRKIHMSPAIYGLASCIHESLIIWVRLALWVELQWDKLFVSACMCVCMRLCVRSAVPKHTKGQGVAFTYAWGRTFPADHWFDLPHEITTEICLPVGVLLQRMLFSGGGGVGGRGAGGTLPCGYVCALFTWIHLHLYPRASSVCPPPLCTVRKGSFLLHWWVLVVCSSPAVITVECYRALSNSFAFALIELCEKLLPGKVLNVLCVCNVQCW